MADGSGKLFRSLNCSKERRRSVLHSQHLSDCEFVVGYDPKESPAQSTSVDVDDIDNDTEQDNEQLAEANLYTFHCHKMVLAISSEVFECMFYGGLANESSIRVDDIEPKYFQIFLEYIYTYELNVYSLENKDISNLLYIGKKYMMQDFIDDCVATWKSRIWAIDDVLPIFQVAIFYDNMPLILHCYKEMRKHATALPHHYTFRNMDVSCMKRFVVVMSEYVDSYQLFKALELYGSLLDKTSQEFEQLVEAAMLMNFKKLSHKDFVSGPVMSFLFRNRHQEVCALYQGDKHNC